MRRKLLAYSSSSNVLQTGSDLTFCGVYLLLVICPPSNNKREIKENCWANTKGDLDWSFDKPQNPLVDRDVSFLVTRETWFDVLTSCVVSFVELEQHNKILSIEFIIASHKNR